MTSVDVRPDARLYAEVQWGVILAGALCAAALAFVLHSFAAALGLSLGSTAPTWRDASFALVALSCLGISALYELVEWWAALVTGEAAEAFLGTQGDPWDTQWDMFLAGVGACSSQLLLPRVHDRQIEALAPAHPRAL